MRRIWRQIPVMGKAALIAVLVLIGYQFVRSTSSTMFFFEVANDQLFAIESGGSYGMEVAVYSTNDVGESWHRFESPAKTLFLGGNGVDLLALTSNNQVWRRSRDTTSWTLVASLPGTHHYSILVDRRGRFLVSGINELTWHADDGRLLRRISAKSSPDDFLLFGNAFFVDDTEEKVVVEVNPFSVYLLNLRDGSVTPWDDGLPASTTGGGGLGRLRRFGKGFLFGGLDGVYASNGVHEPWQRLIEFRQTGDLDDEFCRDLVTHDVWLQNWLLATNPGIRLMQGDQVVHTIFVDSNNNQPTNNDHYLILQIVPFHDYYFVSFARLKNRAIGVRMNDDLATWKTIRLAPQ